MKLAKADLDYLKKTYKDYDENLYKDNLDGLIVECCYDDNMKCYPLRLRKDKEFPNVFKTCLSNFENRMDPFENDESDEYF